MIPLKSARVTQIYGVKNKAYVKGYHPGIDLAATETSIYAALPGRVLESRFAGGNGADSDGWGNYVILRAWDGKVDIIYAHLARVQVTRGQTVTEGTVLGQMGSTGNSTGPHLHFEVRKAPWTNREEIDPAGFLGIYNRIGPAESVPTTSLPDQKEGKGKMFKNVILCNPGPDERAAGYLADYLKAPVCFLVNTTPELLDSAERIYVVGSTDKESSKTTSIVGVDRYDTCRMVLDICKGK